MIKIASFPIEKPEEANSFMEKNPPRSTEKQSGIVFHNGSIVVIYDDGKENKFEKKGMIKSLLEGERHKLFVCLHRLNMSKIALDKIAPKGYTPSLSDTKLKKLIEEANSTLSFEQVKNIMNQLANLDNEIRMDMHEKNRLDLSIEAYESELK